MAAKFFGQFAERFACDNQFDDLLALLRRMRRFGIAVMNHLDSFLT